MNRIAGTVFNNSAAKGGSVKLTIDEDAGSQTVNLSGITAGPGESVGERAVAFWNAGFIT